MPETGFQRKPRAERGSAVTELRTTAARGARYAWAAPVILLLVGVDLFMGMSSEAFDRLKEAHFLRDVGLPAVGNLDPVVWFGIFWLVGMVLGFFAMGWLLKRFERGGAGRHELALRFHGSSRWWRCSCSRSRADRARNRAPLPVFFARDLLGRSTRSG